MNDRLDAPASPEPVSKETKVPMVMFSFSMDRPQPSHPRHLPGMSQVGAFTTQLAAIARTLADGPAWMPPAAPALPLEEVVLVDTAHYRQALHQLGPHVSMPANSSPAARSELIAEPLPAAPEGSALASVEPVVQPAPAGKPSASDTPVVAGGNQHLPNPAPQEFHTTTLQETLMAELQALAFAHSSGDAPTQILPQPSLAQPAVASGIEIPVLVQPEPEGSPSPVHASETDHVLQDVQSTLDSLAGMAHGLSQQKLESIKQQEVLEERRLQAQERERHLAEQEERLRQLEQRLQRDKQTLEHVAEQQTATFAERSAALQALAETVDGRDRSTAKRAEMLAKELQHFEQQQAQLRQRAAEQDERESTLQRQSAELAERLKRLVDAKDRFSTIVKSFNETVRFNTALSAISQAVTAPGED